MRRLIIYTFIAILNNLWSLGVDALLIPQKANILALSGAGIGGNVDIGINPSCYEKPYFGFSSNTWLGGVKGQKSTWIFEGESNRFISFESMGVDDIEFHTDNDFNPEGYISANWFSFDFGSKFDISNNQKFNLGMNIKLNYSKIYTDNSWGYALDLGATHKIYNDLSIGYVIKNLGSQYYSSNEKEKIEPLFGIGISDKMKILSSDIFFMNLSYYIDFINHQNNNIYKLGLQTSFPFINFMFGTSRSNDYNDYSYGFSFKLNDFMLIFGNINHENNALGNPQSIELRRYF